MTDVAANSMAPRLLAGTATGQRLDFNQHVAVHGPLALPNRKGAHQFRDQILNEIDASGLTGRGGGGFPTGTKLRAYIQGHRRHAMVINVMEGEPAAQKDSVLACYAPHLILDGAEILATIVHAPSITVAVARDNPAAFDSLSAAVAERQSRGKRPFDIKVVAPPSRYVASEESALANWLDGGMSLPTFRESKPARLPVRGRGAVVDNAETAAAVALIARHGGTWFASGGINGAAGTTLITIAGAVADPGVFEVPLGTPVRDVLALAKPIAAPTALLLGGYGGTFVGPEALDRPYSRNGLVDIGGNLGAGVIIVFNSSSCIVAEAARIARWMANESAGQCGPCVFGLPAMAAELGKLAAGSKDPALERSLTNHFEVINGRGACAHPDGVVRMARTALAVAGDDVANHLQGQPCAASRNDTILNLPYNEGEIEWK
jgi:NADH:ubiquinone oxidoreductase subunit F (NADH-binding)